MSFIDKSKFTQNRIHFKIALKYIYLVSVFLCFYFQFKIYFYFQFKIYFQFDLFLDRRLFAVKL